MWFVVCTGKGKENAAKSFLLSKVKGAKEVYITPYRKIRHIDENGQSEEIVLPLLMSYVFVNIKLEKRISSKFQGLRTNMGEKEMVFRQLSKCLGKGGYLQYHIRVSDKESGKNVTKKVSSGFHLLCANPSDTPLNRIIEQSWVPDKAMNAFIVYNSQAFSSADQLRIEPVEYSKLIKEHDIVRVLRGPLAGQEGVVKRSHKGKSDRRFYIEFSNNLCLSIAGIHQNDLAIVHEATQSKNAKAVSLWRDIDAVIGVLQFNSHPDEAPKVLRSLLRAYGQKTLEALPSLSGKARLKAEKESEKNTLNHKLEVLSLVPPQARDIFKVVGDYFCTYANTENKVLREFIPNAPIRPFLTPTSGVDICDKEYTILHHEDFAEYVVKKNLSAFFNVGSYEKKKYSAVFDEDYQYYAHVAIIDDNGTRKAVAPWGDFYDAFANLSIPQKKELAETLLKRKYTKTFNALKMSHYIEAEDGSENGIENNPDDHFNFPCVFEKVKGIGGFSMKIEGQEDYDTVRSLIEAVAPVAVEIWQGTRLQEWRQLLQRYVLLHKVPVIDLPSIIENDAKLESLFNVKDSEGKPDLTEIANGVKRHISKILDAYNEGNLYKVASAFLKIAKYTGSTFVEDELYNYIGEKGNELDSMLTKVYNEIIAPIHDKQIKAFLDRGYGELCGMDAWKFFHLPSFLKKAVKSQNC